MRFMRIVAVVAIFGGFVIAVPAQATVGAGRVLSVRGTATVSVTGAVSRQIQRGEHLPEGATVSTGEQSAVRLLMKDRSLLDLGPGTRLKLAQYGAARAKKERKVSLKLFAGRLWARISKWGGASNSFVVGTSNAVAGVRGTEFVVDAVEDGDTTVTCISGSVVVQGIDSDVVQALAAMQRSVVDLNGAGSVSAVSGAEVAQMSASVKSGGTLDAKSAGGRLTSAVDAGAAADGGAPASSGGQSGAGGGGDDSAGVGSVLPPPEIEPDQIISDTTVNGRVEVRE